MRALLIGPGDPPHIEFVPDHPDPRPAPGEVLVRVTLAGICATDLELARGYMQFAGVPGHELVGIVVHGPAHLLNQRVVGEINCPCGRCETCRRGLGRHCPHRTVLGIAGRDGAFAELLTLPAANCHLVPKHVTDEQAVFTEPLAAAVHVLDAVELERGTRVAVLGSGRLGLLVAQVLARAGCDLELFGRNPRTLAWAARHGLRITPLNHVVETGTHDVVVECTGAPEGLALALRLCRPCGTLVLKSTYAGPAGVDLAPVVINEVRVVGSRCGEFGPALRLLAEGGVAVDGLVTATFPLEDGPAALAAAARPEHIKVLLKP
ncbi:MAG: alcohol dehydrogenase catalytic domain-containing protein [Planctomycetota bacterium]